MPCSSTPSPPAGDQLAGELLSAIQNEADPSNHFEALALRLFSRQYQHNKAYKRYCDALGLPPRQLKQWQDIPTVPTDAFKLHSYPLSSVPANQRLHTFHTSGTTTETVGLHHFPSLELYQASISSGWQQLNLPALQKTPQILFLTRPPDQAPHSSLSHMMGQLAKDARPARVSWGLSESGSPDIDRIHSLLDSGQPTAVLGTALAFLHLFDRMKTSPLRLPAGSWAMETGGYKGTHNSLSKEALYQLFEQQLGLGPDQIINEYSMTELSSQFYTSGLGKAHRGPDWTRIRVIDPLSGLEAPAGTPGHLAIYDLANLHSVLAIQTQDLAIAHDERSFTLLGRDPAALPRGCSRAADATMQDPS